MRHVIRYAIMISMVYAGTASAELATPDRILSVEDAHFRDMIQEGTFVAKQVSRSQQQQHDEWQEPVMQPVRFDPFAFQPVMRPMFAYPVRFAQPVRQIQQSPFPRAASFVFGETPLQTVNRVAAMYPATITHPKRTQIPQQHESVPVVVVSEHVSSVEIKPAHTTIVSVDDLSPDVRAFIEQLSRESQEHELKKLTMQFEQDKALILEEQRQSNVLMLYGGIGFLVMLALLHHSVGKFMAAWHGGIKLL